MWSVLASLVFASVLAAQSVEIRSEFQRVDPFGNVVAADRMDHPREILSPAIARNAWASFHVTVTIPEGTPSFLYIQQNPEFFQIHLYRELYAQTKDGWVPDRLQPVEMPVTVLLPDIQAPIRGQKVVSYWLDIWVPERTPAGRMRMQAVLKSGSRWIVAPMEMRVMEAVAPGIHWQPGLVPPAAARADAAVCPAHQAEHAPSESIRQFLHRNALQYTALARSLGMHVDWCAAPGPDAEWFLRSRERLFRPVRDGVGARKSAP